MGGISGAFAFGACATSFVRMADAMLRALGGTEVVLRFKGGPLSDGVDGTSRLGVSTMLTEDIAFSPAVLQQSGESTFECMISARAVEEQMEKRQSNTAEEMLQSALGVVHNEKILRIRGIAADLVSGQPYLYRLTVQE